MTAWSLKSSARHPASSHMDVARHAALGHGGYVRQFGVAKRTERPDVCAHLLVVCGWCQSEFLDTHGITCFFDVDSGAISVEKCDLIGQIVVTLIRQIGCEANIESRGGRITVTLHHTGQVWILAVADQGVRTFDYRTPVGSTAAVQGLARALGGTCRTQLTAHGAITAVLFVAKPWWVDTRELDMAGFPAPRLSAYGGDSGPHGDQRLLTH